MVQVTKKTPNIKINNRGNRLYFNPGMPAETIKLLTL